MHVQGAKAQHKLTQEMLRDRAAQVNTVALDRLLQHTRRGSLQALWETAFAEADARLTHCGDTSAGRYISLQVPCGHISVVSLLLQATFMERTLL